MPGDWVIEFPGNEARILVVCCEVVQDVTVQQIGDCKVEVDGLHYDVTLARTGSCTVLAENSNAAMVMVNDMPSSELSGTVTWCDSVGYSKMVARAILHGGIGEFMKLPNDNGIVRFAL